MFYTHISHVDVLPINKQYLTYVRNLPPQKFSQG
jgi:hypothetical protein